MIAAHCYRPRQTIHSHVLIPVEGDTMFTTRSQTMPVIDPKCLDCVVYLYYSRDQAERGIDVGGTGFFVGMNFEDGRPFLHAYIVTNAHIVSDAGPDGPIVVRINTLDGHRRCIESRGSDWECHPAGDDLAVLSLRGAPSSLRIATMNVESFVTREAIQRDGFGIGDDVFMVGRYVDHQGTQRNLPTVRFGNIAQMPDEPIVHPDGHEQESFLVDMRSIGGFSGAPVFLYTLATGPKTIPTRYRARAEGRHPYVGPLLLGVDWAHMPVSGTGEIREKGAPPKKVSVWLDSSMACVIPAWRLLDFLQDERFVQQRSMDERNDGDREPRVVLDTSPDQDVEQ